MNAQNTSNQTQATKSLKKKPSITGGILSVLALVSAGIANLFVRANYEAPTETTTVAEKAGEAVANGTVKTLGVLFGMPFIVLAVIFAIIAIIFLLVRLGKVKATGLVWTIIWIGLSVWAITLAFSALNLIKATPAN